MGIIRCDAPVICVFYTSSRRTHERKVLVRGDGAASAPGEQIALTSVGQGFGLPL